MGEPAISVVVGAYRRERFLREAVDSILAQTVSRDRVEIVVTKNFSSAPIDAYLSAEGVTSLYDDDPHIGPWLSRAIATTHAPLVGFLDDDDRFEPNRLARVLEVFGAHPELGYYRNRVSVVDTRNEPIPRRLWALHEVDAALDGTGPLWVAPSEKVASLTTLRRLYPLFNSSSIVVRRPVLEGEMAERFRETQNPDPLMFLAGVVAPYGMFFDDQRLTRYRRHPENITKTVWALRHGFEDSQRLAEIAERRAPPAFAAWMRARSVHIEKRLWTETISDRLLAGATRAEIAPLAAGYLRFLARHPEERGWDAATWAAPAYAAASLTLPGIPRRVRAATAQIRGSAGERSASAPPGGDGAARI